MQLACILETQQETESHQKQNNLKHLGPALFTLPPPARTHVLVFRTTPEQRHLLTNNCPNTWSCDGSFTLQT